MPAFHRKVHTLLHSENRSFHSFLIKKIYRRILLCSCALALAIGSGLLFARYRAPRAAHEELALLAEELIAHEFSDNSLSLHYSFSDPERYLPDGRYGLDCSKIALPVYTETTAAEAEAFYSSFMTRLSNMDADYLSGHDLWVFRILEDSLRSTMTGLSFPFYWEPLSPSSGKQTSLLILLAEYRLESRGDVEDYLALLSCVGDYFDGLLLYEQQKAEAGLFMSDAAAEKVIGQCDTLCTEDALAQGTHFLQTTFRSRLQGLVDTGICTEKEAEQYLAQNDAVLTNVVAPAYARLADGLFLLKGSGVNDEGLCRFDQGALYYRSLLSSVTGSARSPEEIMTLLTQNFAADYDALCEIALSLQNTLENSSEAVADAPMLLSFDSPEQMVEDLRTRMADAFPPLAGNIRYEIKPVDDALCAYTSPAFYMVPAMDNVTRNSIYINYGDAPDALTLYTTLAHEGYPGHLYQNVFHLTDMDGSSLLPLEGILSYGGYVEGWATYVEDLSYAYAAEAMCGQNGFGSGTGAGQSGVPSGAAASALYPYETLSELCSFYRIDRRIQLCLYSILDLSIHYYGMTRQEAGALLNAYGISDTDVINSVYDYIVEEPANYPKYYLGYLEIVSLKETAKAVWGRDYSDLRFHTFFLESGPAPFAMLQEALKNS